MSVAVTSATVCLAAAAVVFASPTYIMAVSIGSGVARGPVAVDVRAGRASRPGESGAATRAAGSDLRPPVVASSAPDEVRDASGRIPRSSDASVGRAVVPVAPSGPGAAGEARLYGTVTGADGKPLSGATVVVVQHLNGTTRQVASFSTGPDGTFSGTIPSPEGSYRVLVSVDVGGKTVRGSTRFEMTSGTSYGVTARLIERSFFAFMPIPGY